MSNELVNQNFMCWMHPNPVTESIQCKFHFQTDDFVAKSIIIIIIIAKSFFYNNHMRYTVSVKDRMTLFFMIFDKHKTNKVNAYTCTSISEI